MNTLPEILKAWQGERTLTAASVALNVGISTFHAYLAGTMTPRHRQVANLAPRLGITELELHDAIARTKAKQIESSTPVQANPIIEAG